MTTQSNARFWTWWNGGWVKLTLRPRQTITLHRGWKHEEGWSEEIDVFIHEGGAVRNEHTESGRDCDGRLDRYSDFVARLDQLQNDSAYERWSCPENEGIYTPNWHKLTSSQRDEYAELAGY